jgi:hypothetical protein
MKKFITVVLGVILTLGAIALTSSCKKDIDNAQALVGSIWVAQDGADVYRLSFTSSTEFRITREGDNKIVTGVFIITGNKSTLAGSHITFSPNGTWMDGDEGALSGKFESESKLRIESEDLTFIRSVQ